MRIFLRVRRAYATGGLPNVVRLARGRLSSGARKADGERRSTFDERYGTDTSGRIDQIELDTHGFPTWFHGFHYQPSGSGLIKMLIAATEIDPRAYTFVDLGSGKGRMVLEAAEAGFRRSIGVEFSVRLNDMAKKNTVAFLERGGRGEVEFVHADASEFVLPSGPVIVFLYNPFGEPVMRRVAQRAAERQAVEHKPLAVWYHNPICADCWDEAGFARSLELTELDTVIWCGTER